MNEREKPVVIKGDGHVDEVQTHPAFGLISASRVTSGGGEYLHGSDFKHRNFIVISIHRAELNRSLSHDWSFARDEVVRIALSEAQWATFVSTLNSSPGAECTLERIQGEMILSIERVTTKHEVFKREMDEHLQRQLNLVKTLREQIESATISQKKKDELTRTLSWLENELKPNLDYLGKTFGEHVERTQEKMKTEVAAYIEASIRHAGLQGLGAPPLQLEDEHDGPERSIGVGGERGEGGS